jgi:bifunctional N-acetylglutamate synthase/kinase
MPDLREIVIELLGQLVSSREARQYLNRFSQVEEARFAVVKVGGAVLRDELEELATALAFLHRLGLHPIVLHGAGLQLDEALAGAGVEASKEDGLRVTTEEVMAVARPVIYRENLRLVEAIERRGAKARSIVHGVFESRLTDRDRLGLVGEVGRVECEGIRATVKAGAMPVVSCLGESPSGQVMNINADVAARELVRAIRPHKVIFITSTGGLLDENGRIISAITLAEDYDHLLAQPWVHSGMRLKLKAIRELVESLPPDASVSITSARNLTRELFTHTGAGTLVRRGERIQVAGSVTADLKGDLERLVEQGFGRRLRPDWLEERKVQAVLIAESKRAAAVVLEGTGGPAYLDKFVVTPEAQGEGLAGALWQVLITRFPRLYWRSRVSNPVNNWYFRRADTTLKRDGWIVFTLGLDDPAAAEGAARDALARDPGWAAGEEEP